MATMKAAQVTKPGAPMELVEQDIPEPGRGQVRIRVLACGICRGDALVKEGHWPGIQYPRVPGHEIAGVVDEVGEEVRDWKRGQRVGVGWYGGHCGECRACRRGDFINCSIPHVTGITYDGGYQEYVVAPAAALALIPSGIAEAEAATLVCAGVTVFNALRHSGALPGDLVAIQGVGGLGHLGIQFANRFGFRVAAISRGKENGELARQLGAHHYIDSQASNPADQLKNLGGARVILSTAPSGKSMTALIDGLGTGGKMMVVGASMEPIEVTPVQLMMGQRSLQGWASGTASDSEDALNFAVLTGVRPMIEKYPLARVNEAYERMMSGKAQYRVVLTVSA